MFLACLPVCECGYCKKPAEKQNYAKEKKEKTLDQRQELIDQLNCQHTHKHTHKKKKKTNSKSILRRLRVHST